jgi:hypothetical protein
LSGDLFYAVESTHEFVQPWSFAMQCVPHGLQSRSALTDPLLTMLSLAAISLTAISFQELANDLPYSKFMELVKSNQSNTIQAVEVRAGVRDILGGHTLFVQLEPHSGWKSVFVPKSNRDENLRTMRQRDIQTCCICTTSIPLFKALPSLLFLILASVFFRLGQIWKYD